MLTFLFLLAKITSAQIQITLIPKFHQGGQNISCHGATDGEIDLVVRGGIEPYLFNWSNGSFNQNQQNLGEGVYTVVVTDANNQTESATITLFQPNPLQITLKPLIYDGGYHISATGKYDGAIEAYVKGGRADYVYVWSNNTGESGVSGLNAGPYSLTVTDMNSCTTSASVVLTEPTPLQVINITSPLNNGYNVSCYEGSNGAINLVVAGGVQSQPYKYIWSTGRTTQNLTGLGAGNYSVRITDVAGASVATQITLTEPPLFKISAMVPSLYPNGKNLSCYTCSNGSITVNTTGGVGTLSYLWESGQTTQTISNQQAGTYFVTVTDANGCKASSMKSLVAPERDDWSMFGNANVIPDSQFIGTKDNKDFVFRTNNIERLRILNTSEVYVKSNLKLSGFNMNTYQTPLIDSNGVLKQRQPWTPGIAVCTIPVDGWYYATSNANDIAHCNGNVGIGTSNPLDLLEVKGAGRFSSVGLADYLKIEHNGTNALINKYGAGSLIFQNTLILDDNGKVGIGVTPPTSLPLPNSISDYSFFVDGGIMAERVMVALKGSTIWPDYVFSKNYKLQNLDELENYISIYKHLPGMPTASEAMKGVDVLKMQVEQLKKIEELTLYVIQLKKDNEELRRLIFNK